MQLNPARLVVVALAATVSAIAGPAFGQGVGPLQQPPGGLLRPATDPNSRQKLDLAVNSTGGYDNNSAADGTAIGLGGQDPPGYSSLLESAADYAFQGRRLRFRATGTSAQRYFRSLDNVVPASFRNVSQTAALGFSVRTRRTLVAVNQTGVYSTAPLYNLFAPPAAIAEGETILDAGAPSAAPSLAVNDFESHAYGSALTMTRFVTRRSEITAGVDWRKVDTVGQGAPRRELTTYGVRGQMSRRIARNVVATGGYFYRVGDILDPVAQIASWRLPEHGVQAGLDYRRSFSKTRQFSMGGRVGASTLLMSRPGESADANQRFNPLSGELTAEYEFEGTWRIHGVYRRAVDYAPGVNEPLSTQGVTAGVETLLTRRVDVMVAAGYATGQSTVIWGKPVLNTYTGNARLRYALARTLAAYVEYLYYFYDSGQSASLGPGVPPRLDRRGVRAGLTWRLGVL